MRGREEIDLVDGFSYPLPVTVICELLGIPPSDEPKVQGWTRTFARVLDPDLGEEDRLKSVADFEEVTLYVSALVKEKRKRPAGDVLSGLATYRDKKLGRMGKYDLIANAALLLVAGHETTVNLITSGMLTLLRHPEWLERLRQDPALAPRVVDELPLRCLRVRAMKSGGGAKTRGVEQALDQNSGSGMDSVSPGTGVNLPAF